MIVYFAAAIRGDRALGGTVRDLVNFLKEKEIKVLTEHLAKDDPVDRIPAQDIESRDIGWLDQATHVIAEISGASTGVGREIEYARTKGMMGRVPAEILCIYRSDREHYASAMIRGMTPDRYPNIEVISYSDLEDAKSKVWQFLSA